MQPNNSSEESKNKSANGRGNPSKERPWCWQEKKTLKLITETFAESNQAGSARSLYLALTELASDMQCESFKASKALIAHKSGLSIKTVERLLHGLETLPVVRIDREVAETGRGSIRAANTYTLLSMRLSDAASMRHHGRQPSKSDKVEESGKIYEKRKKNVAADARAHESERETQLKAIAATATDFSDLIETVKPFFPALNLEDEARRFGNYQSKKDRPQTALGFIGWLKRARPTLCQNQSRYPEAFTAEDFKRD